jgi:hypothetical protein
MINYNYGLLFTRDKETEDINTTIAKGYSLYVEKYKEEPSLIECSLKDFEKDFQYKEAIVFPSKYQSKGTIWITGKYFEKLGNS